jgi:signal transduction histidine kinase
MEDISQKMRERFPKGDGKFAVTNYDLERNGQRIGKVNISSFSPYFFNDDEFQFLDSLNVILAGAGIFSLLLAVAVGCLMARHLSEPIRKTAEIAKKMSGGDYVVRMGEESSISELHDLMMSINQLANSLSKQESLRKQLTADVAHELRTPLTNVATHIEAMMEGLWKLTPERLSSCHEEVERISELVRDIENLAMVESDNLKLDKTSVDLSELAEKTLRNFEGDISNKAIAVSIEGNCPAIPADRNRIHQVLTNLLSNAVKYTPTNGTIRVLLSEEVDTVLLSVEDDGIGIASDEVPFIFERFYRAGKSRNRMSGGTGIGLAIVKSIVAAHGGKIEVESHVDKGSCFQVMLPK